MSTTLFFVFDPAGDNFPPAEDWTQLARFLYADSAMLLPQRGSSPLLQFAIDFESHPEEVSRNSPARLHPIRHALVVIADLLRELSNPSGGVRQFREPAVRELLKLRNYLEAAIAAGCERFYMGII
jgi:hypothetical protein